MKNYRMPLIGGNYATSGRQKYLVYSKYLLASQVSYMIAKVELKVKVFYSLRAL